MGSLELVRPAFWRGPIRRASEQTYRLDENYDRENLRNGAVPSEDCRRLCTSCRLTRVIPNLKLHGHNEACYRLEVAKHRELARNPV